MSSASPCAALDDPTHIQAFVACAGLIWQPVGRPCVKRISLGQLGQVLCFHLRRAYWTNQGRHIKLSGHVKFPLQLDVSPHRACNRAVLSAMGQQYEPSAVEASWVGTAPEHSPQERRASASLQQPGGAEVTPGAAVDVSLRVEVDGHVTLLMKAGHSKAISDQNAVSPIHNGSAKPPHTASWRGFKTAHRLASPPQQAVAAQTGDPADASLLSKQHEQQHLPKRSNDSSAKHQPFSSPRSSVSPFASHKAPFSPKAVPKHMLTSHALSFASSSVLGSDEEDGGLEGNQQEASDPSASEGLAGSQSALSSQAQHHSGNGPGAVRLHGKAQAKTAASAGEQQATAGDDSSLFAHDPSNAAESEHRCSGLNTETLHEAELHAVQPTAAVHEANHDCAAAQCGTNEPSSNTLKPYQLTAAVVHHGSGSSSGHYTVYRGVVDHCSGQAHAAQGMPHWYSISDEHVQPVNVQDVLLSEATLLFYKQSQ